MTKPFVFSRSLNGIGKSVFLILFTGMICLACAQKELVMEDTSMEGTIKKGSSLQVLDKDEILRNQVVAFRYQDKYFGEKTAVMRVVGVPGDTIKVSLGQLFVNGDLFEEPEKIKYMYQVITDGQLPASTIQQMEYQQINSKEFIFHITRQEAEILRNLPVVITLRIMVRDWGIYQPGLFGSDSLNNWNIDNYGPIKVPLPGEHGVTEKLYFVMGDNRHNAIDSRYIGYIPGSNILGIVKYR